MSEKIAVTGKPGCGKTTLCRKVAESFEGEVRGLLTEEIREVGKRKGFKLEDLETGETGLLAHVTKCSGPRVGKYSVCLHQLDSFASQAIGGAIEESDLLVIDEIGPMELKSSEFVRSVKVSLNKEINCLFTLHLRSNHPLLEKIRKEFRLKELTRENRDRMYERILSTLGSKDP